MKKVKGFNFNDDVKPKDEKLFIHEHLLNNSSCAEYDLYKHSKFYFINHLTILKSMFIRTCEQKLSKRRDYKKLKQKKYL